MHGNLFEARCRRCTGFDIPELIIYKFLNLHVIPRRMKSDIISCLSVIGSFGYD